MNKQANQLAARGRYGDTELVHMSRPEVASMEAYVGGDLPRNPDTGLPEAFILPLIGGIAGGFFGGPLGAAAGSGLGTYLETGDIEKGLMSGLLSFGVGSALGSLASTGTEAAATAATEAAATSAASSGAAGVAGGLPAAVTPATAIGSSPGFFPGAETLGSPLAAQSAGNLSMAGFPSAGLPPTGLGGTASRAWETVTGPGGMDALSKTFIDEASTTTMPIGLGLAGMMQPEPREFPGLAGAKTYDIPEAFPDERKSNPVYPDEDFRPGIDGEFDYFPSFAEGGQVAPPPDMTRMQMGQAHLNHVAARYQTAIAVDAPNRTKQEWRDVGNFISTFPVDTKAIKAEEDAYYKHLSKAADADANKFAEGGMVGPQGGMAPQAMEQLMLETQLAILNQHPDPEAAILRFIDTFGQQAYMEFRTQVLQQSQAQSPVQQDTRLITGAGGPKDDAIPAVVDNVQQAALSNGEVVMPADVVAGMGGGDAVAGAERLMQMGDQFRGTQSPALNVQNVA